VQKHIAAIPPRQEPARLVFEESLDCQIAGSLIRIEGLPASVRRHVADLLQPFINEPAQAEPLLRLQIRRRGAGKWALFVNGSEASAGCGTIACLLPSIERHALIAALDANTRCAVVRAAALTRGRATVLLLAPTCAGKTTLTLGLIGRGWEPFTDGIALIEVSTLQLHPFPRCFRVMPSTLELLPEPLALEWPGVPASYARPMRWAEGEQQPTGIILVQRNPQCPSELTPILRAEAAGAILSATMRNQLSGSQRSQVAVRMASQASACYRLNNGSLAEALDLIEAAACGT
jgi:hypothetical protein